MKFFLVLFLFLILGGLLIVSNNEINFLDEGDFDFFSGAYVSWVSGIFYNLKSVTIQVFNMSWLP